MTYEEMVIDLMAHRHIDDPKFREEIVTEDFEAELAALAAEVAAPDEWEVVTHEEYGGKTCP
jgi:hypothetical protein